LPEKQKFFCSILSELAGDCIHVHFRLGIARTMGVFNLKSSRRGPWKSQGFSGFPQVFWLEKIFL